MGQLKRTLRNTGISLTVAGVGIVGAAGAASAHDAASGHAVWGTVSAVGTGSFTITTHPGTTETIDTTPTTTYAEPGTTVAPAGVVEGQDVVVQLDPSDATPTAVEVVVLLDRVSGKVTAVTSTSITLSGPRDTSRDVVISPSTTYYEGKTSATGVTDGEFVTAFGTWDTTTPTELDALFVDIGNKTTVCPPRSPRIAPTGTAPTSADPSSGTWGNHAPGAAPAVAPSTAPKGGTPFSHGSAPQTTGATPSGSGNGFGHGFSGNPASGGQGGHGFPGGSGGRGGRG